MNENKNLVVFHDGNLKRMCGAGKELTDYSVLNRFNNQILDVLNTGDASDVDLKDVRQLFSDEAGDLIRELQYYFGELDRIGKDPCAWQSVCSSRVVELSDAILGRWQKLIEIIARKCWRRVKSLEREYDEWSKGL